MQEKVIEIIVYILNEMRNSKHINEIDIKRLNSDGYTDAEINTAFVMDILKDGSRWKKYLRDTVKKQNHTDFSIIRTEYFKHETKQVIWYRWRSLV